MRASVRGIGPDRAVCGILFSKKQKKLTLSYLESVTLSWTERGIAFRGAIRYSTWKEAMKFEQVGYRSFDY